MRPVPGDLLILKHVESESRLRDGRILDIRGDESTPTYVVQWSDTGDVEMYVADERAFIHHFERPGTTEFSLATGFSSTPSEDALDEE